MRRKASPHLRLGSGTGAGHLQLKPPERKRNPRGVASEQLHPVLDARHDAVVLQVLHRDRPILRKAARLHCSL